MNRPTQSKHGKWTYSEYARLPDDGNRYEVIDGEVVVTAAPTPHHQKVISRLCRILEDHVETRGLGWVFQDVDLLFVSAQFLRPDLLVVPARAVHGITDRGVEETPLLVVEVLSPSTRTIDRVKKSRRYLEIGVPAYWVVDPLERAVWIWDGTTGVDAPHRVTSIVRWLPQENIPPLEVDVALLVAPL
jgi:Uma2 family endonuclease